MRRRSGSDPRGGRRFGFVAPEEPGPYGVRASCIAVSCLPSVGGAAGSLLDGLHMAIFVNDRISLADDEVSERFVRSPGPGGQNVNKVATAVQLRFDARGSGSIPEDVRARLIDLAGTRVTKRGVIVIDAHRFRTREKNREDALQRLVSLVRRAAVVPKTRKPTRPSPAAEQRRMEAKRRRSELKHTRLRPDED